MDSLFLIRKRKYLLLLQLHAAMKISPWVTVFLFCCAHFGVASTEIDSAIMILWLVAGADLLREKSTADWLVAGGWFGVREKYC